jgi:hypothetical protein
VTGSAEQVARLPKPEQRGSRLRCILFTDGEASRVAARFAHITSLPRAAPLATVDPARHTWLPRGFDLPAELELGKATGFTSEAHARATAEFISDDQAREIRDWWLVHSGDARLPSWDIAAQATIEGREGLILIEAKAHDNELSPGGKRPSGFANHERIGQAVSEANEALNLLCPGWDLKLHSRYQLVNRFAWAWKLASMGVPVVLIYLGFVQAIEMSDLGTPIRDRRDWERLMFAHSRGVVPPGAWEQRFVVEGTPFRALIRSTSVTIPVRP